ncbi:hypothetical protein HDU80_009934 [Chytriomyces hyalinus]|nr:hypothetical protein HDU80_009934 [Chytriomyces hyalinus]
MKLTLATLLSAIAVAAQTSTDSPAAPPSAPAAPAANSKQSITIITPTGNKAYKVGENMTITWNNNADPSDVAYQFTDITFELADASGGINKVTPLGVYFETYNKNASVGLLDVTAPVPQVKAGAAYCVRANIRGSTGFTYYFSPTFPIGMELNAVPSKSAQPAASGAANGAAAATGAAAVSPTPAAVTSKPSGGLSNTLLTFLGALPVLLF